MMILRNFSLFLFYIALVIGVSACSLFRSIGLIGEEKKPGVRLSEVRGKSGDESEVQTIRISRSDFRKTFVSKNKKVRSPLMQLRMVEVFKRTVDPETHYPRYRLFNIIPGSPYDMLGLESGDILVAANDWIVFNPYKFPRYVELLQYSEEGRIEIVRNEQPITFRYLFEGEPAESVG